MRITKGWFNSEQGSFSIEASVVAPLLVLGTLAFIASALFVYQSYELHSITEQTVERAAFTWKDNGAEEGLYGRLNERITSWLGVANGDGDRRIELPVSSSSGSEGMSGKLREATSHVPPDVTGELLLADRLLLRELRLRLQKPFLLKKLALVGAIPVMEQAKAKSVIIDPVELIRVIDLTRSYVSAIQDRLTPAQVMSVLRQPLPEAGTAVPISSERDAAAYLRRVTGGSFQAYPMPDGKSRVVDALDKQGVAHQAFYTYTEHQLSKDQLPKDAKLVRDGTVKGVVWHFFRQAGTPELSPSLRLQLQREGVIIVVHE